MTEPTGEPDESAEFNTPAEEINQVTGEFLRLFTYGDYEHDGCVHGPEVTHSPNMRLRLRMTP